MEIEEYLRKFQPVSPGPELKARVLGSSKPWRPWYLAAAALILLGLLLFNHHLDGRLEPFTGQSSPNPSVGPEEAREVPFSAWRLISFARSSSNTPDSYLRLRMEMQGEES